VKGPISAGITSGSAGIFTVRSMTGREGFNGRIKVSAVNKVYRVSKVKATCKEKKVLALAGAFFCIIRLKGKIFAEVAGPKTQV
jgi:hypothetical protein